MASPDRHTDHKLHLMDLPNELLILIISTLDPATTLRLQRVNKRLQALTLPLKDQDQNLVQAYLHRLEMQFRHDRNLACYRCCTIKSEHTFNSKMIWGIRGKRGRDWRERSCITCFNRKKMPSWRKGRANKRVRQCLCLRCL